jgi:addiction module HigA family antidote
VIVS